MLGTQEKQARVIREMIIREQLKNMLPLDTDILDIIFCAYELNNQINSCRVDVNFKKN